MYFYSIYSCFSMNFQWKYWILMEFKWNNNGILMYLPLFIKAVHSL